VEFTFIIIIIIIIIIMWLLVLVAAAALRWGYNYMEQRPCETDSIPASEHFPPLT
jgi:flagellar basal body-associated protein FliL